MWRERLQIDRPTSMRRSFFQGALQLFKSHGDRLARITTSSHPNPRTHSFQFPFRQQSPNTQPVEADSERSDCQTNRPTDKPVGVYRSLILGGFLLLAGHGCAVPRITSLSLKIAHARCLISGRARTSSLLAEAYISGRQPDCSTDGQGQVERRTHRTTAVLQTRRTDRLTGI